MPPAFVSYTEPDLSCYYACAAWNNMNKHCSSHQSPSLLTIRIPRRLTAKTSESKMRIPVKMQESMPYLNTAVKIQKLKKADIFDPSRRSIAEDLSPADGVARNGSDAKTHQGRYPNHEATIKLLDDFLAIHNSH